jgi:DNA-directed RNA polymerase subunit N (RpoN/RPB10)
VSIDRQRFACWSCKEAQAEDVRFFLRSATDEDIARYLSPMGNIVGCCRRVKLAGVVPAAVNAPAPPIRARRW